MTPILTYPDVDAAEAWLADAFGFAATGRIDGGGVQLDASGPLIIAPGHGRLERGDAIMIPVPNVDAHCAAAVAQGARIVNALATFPYGGRQYSAIDPWGHVWTFSQSIPDLEPDAG